LVKIKKQHKILCIKTRGIGDVVGAMIVIDNLKEYYPDSEIHFLTEDFAAEIPENHPLVDKTLSFNRKEGVLKVSRMLRKEKYDIVIDLYCNPRTALLTLFRLRWRVGFRQLEKVASNVKAKIVVRRAFCEHNLHLLEH
jgi:ADP-heptose:LPS heptosyltransferase